MANILNFICNSRINNNHGFVHAEEKNYYIMFILLKILITLLVMQKFSKCEVTKVGPCSAMPVLLGFNLSAVCYDITTHLFYIFFVTILTYNLVHGSMV